MLPRRDRNTSIYIGLEEHPKYRCVPPQNITIYYSIQCVYNHPTYRLGCRVEQSPDFSLESLNLQYINITAIKNANKKAFSCQQSARIAATAKKS